MKLLNSSRIWQGYLFTVLILTLGLSGCDKKPEVAETAYVKMRAYNHTEDYVHQYYIDGAWGGNSFAYGGGGKFVCCIGVPEEWRPGLTATVRWTTSASRKSKKPYTGETWHEQVVIIEPYGEAGSTMNTHFLPDNKVRLIVSNFSSGYPNYPGPAYPEKPADWPVD
ncbi:DUF3304 domain-containing protein [Pseudomonas putida]|uniref:DUF3304 domain-containing protein n=1 Tax=Pseudomonas putida TaxID=303 RepID=UPI002363E9C6|nr:DUF3304 domain-containing protein [Pseudomonas putida]MDD1964722.1 DUF3304 domain-containing protein [Pseudomonas putida]